MYAEMLTGAVSTAELSKAENRSASKAAQDSDFADVLNKIEKHSRKSPQERKVKQNNMQNKKRAQKQTAEQNSPKSNSSERKQGSEETKLSRNENDKDQENAEKTKAELAADILAYLNGEISSEELIEKLDQKSLSEGAASLLEELKLENALSQNESLLEKENAAEQLSAELDEIDQTIDKIFQSENDLNIKTEVENNSINEIAAELQNLIKEKQSTQSEVMNNTSEKSELLNMLQQLREAGVIETSELQDLLEGSASKSEIMQKVNVNAANEELKSFFGGELSAELKSSLNNGENIGSLTAEQFSKLKQKLASELGQNNESAEKIVQKSGSKAVLLNKLSSLNKDSQFRLFNLEGKSSTDSESMLNLDEGLLDSDSSSELSNLQSQLNMRNTSAQNNNFGLEQLKNSSSLKIENQILQSFKADYSADNKELSVQLQPKSLGKIDIKLSYVDDRLTAEMMVENDAVRSQLKEGLQALKNELVREGINIEQFKIETAKNSPQQVEQDEFAFDDSSDSFNDGQEDSQEEYDSRQYFSNRYSSTGEISSENHEYSSLDERNLNVMDSRLNSALNLLA